MRPDQLDILRLGARDKYFTTLNIATPARLLNTARKQKLPVPNGIILLDSAWERLQTDGVIEKTQTDITIHSADEFLERFALQHLDHTLQITPLFETNSSVTIHPSDSQTLIETLVKQWQSHTTARCDILVTEAINAKITGRATTLVGETDDLVSVNGKTIRLPQLTRWQSPTTDILHLRRVQQLLAGVRRSLNREGDHWTIHWADDREVCWLTTVFEGQQGMIPT